MSECKKGKCFVDAVFPGENRGTWCCDEECFLSYTEAERAQHFKEKHPKIWEEIVDENE